MKPFIISTLLASSLFLFACQKEVPQPQPPAPGIPTSFAELTVDPNFDWNTLVQVNLQFVGYQAPVNVQRKLSVKIPNETNVLFSAFLPIEGNQSFHLQIPKAVTELEVQYGAITKRMAVTAQMQFSPKPEFD